jgi:hypothetical protein
MRVSKNISIFVGCEWEMRNLTQVVFLMRGEKDKINWDREGDYNNNTHSSSRNTYERIELDMQVIIMKIYYHSRV